MKILHKHNKSYFVKIDKEEHTTVCRSFALIFIHIKFDKFFTKFLKSYF